jgi:prepilin peptidase CpaA
MGLAALGLGELLLMGALLAASLHDLRRRKIPNSLVILTAAIAIGLWLTVAFLGFSSFSVAISSYTGGTFLSQFLSGGPLALILAFVLGLPLYVFRVIGGGDYKLVLALSMAMPVSKVPDLWVWILIWNGILALMMILTHGVIWKSFLFLVPKVLPKSMSLTMALPLTSHRGQGIPFSIGIGLGYLSSLQGLSLGKSIMNLPWP